MKIALCVKHIFQMKTQKRVRLRWEAFTVEMSFFYFISVSIKTMINLENDPHLGYLTDKQEPEHHFFKVSVYQSVIALGLGLLTLFHSIAAEQSIIALKAHIFGKKPDILHFFFGDIFSSAHRKANKFKFKTY